jgi:hypothetical protein
LAVPAWQVLPKQQPVQPVMVLHTQLPPTQSWPAPQGALAPQRQAPPTQLSARLVLQPKQALPPPPQLAVVLPGWQEVPLQQPLPHEVVLHWQEPPTHCWPAPQGPLAPQRQAPLAEQPSATMPQLVQARPLTPHAPEVLPALQMPLWQQPPLHAVWLAPPHEVEQVWLLVLHVCPDGQSPALLQPQVLPDRQACPTALDEQSTQALPLLPQVPLPVPPLQVLPAQQPPLHG